MLDAVEGIVLAKFKQRIVLIFFVAPMVQRAIRGFLGVHPDHPGVAGFLYGIGRVGVGFQLGGCRRRGSRGLPIRVLGHELIQPGQAIQRLALI